METTATIGLVIGVAVVTALVAVPLALGKVPRNRLYGVRTSRTLADDRVWYDANAYGGRCLIKASAVTIGTVLILSLTPLPREVLVPAEIAALVIPSLVAAILAMRHAGRISH